MRRIPIAALFTLALTCVVPTRAEQIELTVVDDASIVQDGGADDNNFGGRTELLTSNADGGGSRRRFGLLRFNVASLAGMVGYATDDGDFWAVRSPVARLMIETVSSSMSATQTVASMMEGARPTGRRPTAVLRGSCSGPEPVAT